MLVNYPPLHSHFGIGSHIEVQYDNRDQYFREDRNLSLALPVFAPFLLAIPVLGKGKSPTGKTPKHHRQTDSLIPSDFPLTLAHISLPMQIYDESLMW